MKKILLCLACLLFFYPAKNTYAGDTIPIDLMKQDIYVTPGFSPGWINKIPAEGNWKKIPGRDSGNTRLSIPELKIQGLPQRKWFSLKSYKPELVTIIIPFRFVHADQPESIYGLFFAYLGGGWEIYLNGKLVKSEMHLDGKGEIDHITNSRNILIPLRNDLLINGDNILAIKIFGDPTFVKTGIYQKWPNILSDIKSTYSMRVEILSLILISVYLFIGMYHLFLFALWRSERVNLYFGLLCVVLFCNQFARTTSIYNLITDTNTINRVELVFLFTLLPVLDFFIESVLSSRIQKFTYLYSAAFIVFAVVAALAPLPFVYDMVQVWEKLMAMPILCYIIYKVAVDLKKSISGNNLISGAGGSDIVARSLRGLFFTESGRILLAMVLIAICVLLDIVLKRYYYMHINPSRFGFFLLIVGTTFNLADKFIYIHRRVESLNVSLQEKIQDLNSAYEKISVSEEKYRMLIEGVNHYICTTDLNGYLLTANNILIHDLMLDPESFGKLTILDLFYIPADDKGVIKSFITEKINETIADKKQVSFKAQMKTYYQIEPREMSIYFEIVNIASAQEILVKAHDTIEDSLLKNMVCEKQVLEMGNHIGVAEEISNRLVRNIERYYDPRKITILRIALREMILNSIEHGNLDISYDSKTEALESEKYFEFIAQRQKDPRFCDKKVTIEYTLTSEKVVYVIRDDGEGFDHKKMIDDALKTANEELLSHGRGIAMTRNAFDEVVYNDRGNEVRLIKYFRD